MRWFRQESNRGAAALSRGDASAALEQSRVNPGVAPGRIGAPADAELAAEDEAVRLETPPPVQL